jgi:hypothetical protein
MDVVFRNFELLKEFIEGNPDKVILSAFLVIVFIVLVALAIYIARHSSNLIASFFLVVFGYLAYKIIDQWNQIREQYNLYVENKEIVDSKQNLTEYTSKKQFLFKKFKKYKVFKKSNFEINQYYWQVKTKDSQYFYTETDDTQSTLLNILKTCKISEYKKRMVNDFFEYLLVSYLCKEDIRLMMKLSKGEEVKMPSGIIMKTEDFFRSDITKTFKSPDVHLEYSNEIFFIDAYNGTGVGKNGGNSKEVISKLQSYRESFKTDNVYVFTSNVERIEQLAFSNQQPKFAFYTLRDGKPEEVKIIKIGALKIDIGEINSLYFQEYRVFYTEVVYWLNCEHENKILQTDEDNRW